MSALPITYTQTQQISLTGQYVFLERVPLEKLDKLIQEKHTTSSRKRLEAYRQQLTTAKHHGVRRSKLIFTFPAGIGDAFDESSVSELPASVRQILLGDEYEELQLNELLPDFLQELVRQTGSEFPYLMDLQNLKKLASELSVTKKKAFTLVKGFVHGDKTFNDVKGSIPAFLISLHREIRSLNGMLTQRNSHLQSDDQTVLSVILDDWQRRVVEQTIRFLIDREIVSVNQNEIDCIPLKNGVMLPKGRISQGAYLEKELTRYFHMPISFLSSAEKEEQEIRLYPDDESVMDYFLKKYPNYFHAEDGLVAGYNKNNGFYVEGKQNVQSLFHVLMKEEGSSLAISISSKAPKEIRNDSKALIEGGYLRWWSKSIKTMNLVLSRCVGDIEAHCAKKGERGWFGKMEQSSYGKILFTDGWYDFHTKTFHPGFTPDILFLAQVPFAYQMKWNTDAAGCSYKVMYARVKKILCEDAVLPDSKLLYVFARSVSRSMAGENDRVFYLVFGPSGSGKGTWYVAIKGAFGEYVQSFHASNFIATKNVESARAWTWFIPKKMARIMMSSEVSGKGSLCAEMVKQASGGDAIPARLLHQNERDVNHLATFFMCMNDYHDLFDKTDDGLLNRIQTTTFDYSFVSSSPNEEKQEKQGDPSLKRKFQSNIWWRYTVMRLIIDAYSWTDDSLAEGLAQAAELKKEVFQGLSKKDGAKQEFFEFGPVDLEDDNGFWTTGRDLGYFYESASELRRSVPGGVMAFKRWCEEEVVKHGGVVDQKRNKRNPKVYRNQKVFHGIRIADAYRPGTVIYEDGVEYIR